LKQTTFFIIILLLTQASFAQSENAWVRFYDTTNELSGYKDLKGNIKIPARFVYPTNADTFYNIIAVAEPGASFSKSYYLLKDGRKVGQDSVFAFDFTFDCESEGKILFKDKKKDRVGFFDKNGIAVIPAMYNEALPFHNGLSVALRNATRKCLGDIIEDTLNCEHLGWSGGETILINDKNEILADSLKIDIGNIDWYSKKVNNASVDTSIYITIKGRNNTTYSFINYEKEFAKWFYTSFLPTLNSKKSILSTLFAEVTYWSEKNGWTGINKNKFLNAFPKALTAERFQTSSLKELSISQESTIPFMIESKLFDKYYDACGYNRQRFPAFDVMLTYYKKSRKSLTGIQAGLYKDYKIDFQEHFVFLRTEERYKLLGVSLKK
jgi:hypothetical protein